MIKVQLAVCVIDEGKCIMDKRLDVVSERR